MNLAATKEEDSSQAICTWDRKRTRKILPSNCNNCFYWNNNNEWCIFWLFIVCKSRAGSSYSKDSISFSFSPHALSVRFFFRGVLLSFFRLAPLQTRINIREKEVKLWVNQMQCVAIRTYYPLQQKKAFQGGFFLLQAGGMSLSWKMLDFRRPFSFQFLLW